MKKVVSIFLAFLLCFSAFNVFATGNAITESVKEIYSGTCGDNITWTIDTETGVLDISGSGAMDDFDRFGPWCDFVCDYTTVNINSGVRSIGKSAFVDCIITNGINIADTVESIGEQAFFNCNVDSITIPNGVTSVHDNVFYFCAASTIVIGSGVSHIDEMAFNYCYFLENINVVSENTCFSSVDGVLFNKDKTALIKHPVNSENTSYVVPDSVTQIHGSAFEKCEKLESISMGNSVTSIGGSAFSGCTSLTTATISDSVTNVSGGIFYDCTALTSINIGSGLKELSGVFYHCPNLTSIIAPAENASFCSEGGVLFNKEKTKLVQYPAGKKATWYAIPKTVTTIGYGAFYLCTSLTKVIIPQEVVAIDNKAFYCCTELTDVNFPNGLTKIGDSAFEKCRSLTTVALPWSLTNISYSAFYDCSGLTYVYVDRGSTFTEDVTKTFAAYAKSIMFLSGKYVPDYIKNNYPYTNTEVIGYKGQEYVSYSDHAHTWEAYSVKANGCYENGFDGHKCSVCGALKGDEVTDHVYDHDFDINCNDCGYVREAVGVIGDLNFDGFMDNTDAALTLKYDAALVDLDTVQLFAADVNSDGVVDNTDAALILKYDAGL